MIRSPYLTFAQAVATDAINDNIKFAALFRETDPNGLAWFMHEIKADMFNIALAAMHGDHNEITAAVNGLELFIREYCKNYRGNPDASAPRR